MPCPQRAKSWVLIVLLLYEFSIAVGYCFCFNKFFYKLVSLFSFLNSRMIPSFIKEKCIPVFK